MPQEIIDNADEITEWEAESRYGHSLVTTRSQVEKILDLAERLLEQVRIKETEL